MTLIGELCWPSTTHPEGRDSKHFLAIINRDIALQKLSKEPLILSLLISIFKQFGKIPRNRNEIFDRYILLVAGGWHDIESPLGGLASLRNLLAEMAYTIYCESSIVSLSAVKDFIQSQFQNQMASTQGQLIDKIINQLVYSELMNVTGDQIQFRHEEICWYCIAIWLHENLNISSILRLVEDNRNILDSIYYLSGMLDDSTELIERLLQIDFLTSARAIGNSKFIAEKTCKSVIRYTMNFGDSWEYEPCFEPLAQNDSELLITYFERMVLDREGTDRTRAIAANVLGYIGTEKALNTLISLSKNNDDLVRMRSLVGFQNYIEKFGPEAIEQNDQALIRIASSALAESFDVRFWASYLFGRLRKESSLAKDTLSIYNFFLYAFEGKPGEWPDKCKRVAPEIVKQAIAKLTSFSLGSGSGNWKFRAFCAVALLELYDLYPTDVTLSFVQVVLRGRDDFFVMKAIELLKQMDTKLAAKKLCEELKTLKGSSFDEQYSRWIVANALGILEDKQGINGLLELTNDEAEHVAMQAFDGLSRLAVLYPIDTKVLISKYIEQQGIEGSHKLKQFLNTIDVWERGDAAMPSIDDMRKQDAQLFESSNLMWTLRTGALSSKKPNKS